MVGTYETEADRANEKRIANLLRTKGCDVTLLKRYYPCDFFIRAGNHTYLAEYKRRNHKYGTFDSVMLPALKLSNCRQLSSTTLIPFVLFIEFDDGFFVCYDVTGKFEVGGRADREVDGEYEPVVLIPLSKFNRMEL